VRFMHMGSAYVGSPSEYNMIQIAGSSCSSSHNDVDLAIRYMERSMTDSENIDAISKDMASLLHALGMCSESLIYLCQSTHGQWPSRKIRTSLMGHLKHIIGKPVPPMASRVVYVEVPRQMGKITIPLLKRLIPNVSKIWRVMLSRSGQTCLLEFASHSSARRAVDSRQQSPTNQQTPSIQDAVKCAWVTPSALIPQFDISRLREFPLVEYIQDESVISPSSDWRRPRPTISAPCGATCRVSDVLSTEGGFLTSVLRMTGAFDDYPPDIDQVL
jgi:hypothetical protein